MAAKARTYTRDSRGRFASAAGATKAKPKAAAQKPPKPQRSIASRLARSSDVSLAYSRSADRAPGQRGLKPMTPQKFQHMAKRKRQQKQAIANLYGRLSPASKKRADTIMRRSGIMN